MRMTPFKKWKAEMTEEEETILETVPGSDQIDHYLPLVEFIAQLQSALDQVPERFRHVATFNIHAYDWDGVDVTYERPVTFEERAAKAALIESQRRTVAVLENQRTMEEWIRNVRLALGGFEDVTRQQALEYIQSTTESNQYHPDNTVARKKMDPADYPWKRKPTA